MGTKPGACKPSAFAGGVFWVTLVVLSCSSARTSAQPTDLEKGLAGLEKVVWMYRGICSFVPTSMLSLQYGVSAAAEAVGSNDALTDLLVDRAVTVLRRRLQGMESVAVYPRRDAGVVVINIQASNADQTADVKAAVATPGLLELRLVDRASGFFDQTAGHLEAYARGLGEGTSLRMEQSYHGPTVSSVDLGHLKGYLSYLKKEGLVPEGHILSWQAVQTYRPGSGEGNRFEAFLLHERVWLSGSDVAKATVGWDQFRTPMVSLSFDEQGARVFAEVTAANVERELAIMLDGEVKSAPVIKEAITGGRAQITLGAGGSQEDLLRQAQSLVEALRSGAYPGRLTLLSEVTVPAAPPAHMLVRHFVCRPPLPFPWVPGLLDYLRVQKE